MGLVHIMFLVADHYEPGPNNEIVKQWVEKYPEIAKNIVMPMVGHQDIHGFIHQSVLRSDLNNYRCSKSLQNQVLVK